MRFCNSALLLALAACSAEPGAANAAAADIAAVPAAAVAAAPVAAAAKPANEAFSDFWQRFRKAALAADSSGIAAASAPTVKTHGALDGDATDAVAAASVAPLVAQALASDSTFDASRRTLRQVLESGEAPKRGADDPLGYRRVGSFVFEQVKGRWFLTELYIED
jgi:hypothetical protein